MNRLRSYHDYREMLQEEFENRLKRNPRYSLRAFARDLDASPSRINEVLNYKRGLSRVLASRMAKNLGLTKQETEIFLHQVDATHGRGPAVRARAKKFLKKSRDTRTPALQVDTFKIIADWYHYAILELTKVSGFQSNAAWIAERLDLPVTVIDPAVRRLMRLGLLVDHGGAWVAADSQTFSTNNVPSSGLKKHHEQILQKAQKSIYL